MTLISPDIPAKPRRFYGAGKVWTESLPRFDSLRHGLSCLCERIGQVERDWPRPQRGADIYVSQREIVQVFQRCIYTPADLKFDIFYAMPDTDLRWVDIAHAREVLGYEPQDRAAAEHDYEASGA